MCQQACVLGLRRPRRQKLGCGFGTEQRSPRPSRPGRGTPDDLRVARCWICGRLTELQAGDFVHDLVTACLLCAGAVWTCGYRPTSATHVAEFALRGCCVGLTVPAVDTIVERIISGGQTGADRAALDFAIAHGVPHGGWCPKGRRAEDGGVPDRYALQATPSKEYGQRTEWNVRDAGATVIFTIGPELTGGSELTAECTVKHGKPWLHLAEGLEPILPPGSVSSSPPTA